MTWTRAFGNGSGWLLQKIVNGLALSKISPNTLTFVGLIINVVAAIYFMASGLVHWPAAGVMALGSVIGGYSGAHFAQRIPQQAVRHLITAIGLLLTLVMFIKQLAH